MKDHLRVLVNLISGSETDTHHIKNIQLPDDSLIVIEGVFLQRKEWRSFYDYLVYLDCPRSQRFLREDKDLQKNLTKFKNRYWKAEEFYLVTEEPKNNANLVLRG